METIGSVGSHIGAALETAGQYMQAEMLHVLIDGQVAQSIGIFFYVFSALSAFLILASGGQYKQALTFLIGPPLFYFVVSNRVPSEGVQWRFGSREYDQSNVFRAVSELTESDGTQAFGPGSSIQVPWFFANWNRIVSGTVAAFTAQVQKLQSQNGDLTFINKFERYQSLFRLDYIDPRLKNFAALTAAGKCSDYFAGLMWLNNPAYSTNLNDVAKNKLRERVARMEQEIVFNFDEQPELRRSLEDLGVPIDDNAQYNCKQIWDFGVDLSLREADQIINQVTRSNLPNQLTPDLAREKLAEKFGQYSSNQDQTVSLIEADKEVRDKLMRNEIAVRLLLKQLTQLKPNVAQVGFDKTVQVRREKDIDQRTDTAQSIRELSQREEYQGKGDFIEAMLSMPYIQGLALYFLAMSFPFFAMGLMVPGRQVVLLQWMSLWVWVKSWDFGFAVVMFIDDILYVLMPHGPPLSDNILHDPGAALKAVLQVDPTYSVNTYYMIIAALIAAVPTVTAVFVKKGSNDLVGAISQGFEGIATRVGHGLATAEAGLAVQSHIAQANRNFGTAVQRATDTALSDPTVLGAMAYAKLGASGAQAYLEQQGKNAGKNDAFSLNQKLMWGQAASFAQGLAGSSAERAVGIAKARIEYEFARVLREEGLSPENRRLAARGVLNWWYSHDMSNGAPVETDEMLELEKQRATFRFGKPVDQGMDSIFRGVLKMAHKGTPTDLASAAAGVATGAVASGFALGAATEYMKPDEDAPDPGRGRSAPEREQQDLRQPDLLTIFKGEEDSELERGSKTAREDA